MKKKMTKELRELFKEWFYKMPGSRYNRFCLHCYHRCRLGQSVTFCDWFGDECVDAVRLYCPIPTAMVSMLMEIDAAASSQNEGKIQLAKGGTVVPPSKFHFASTEGAETQKDTAKSPRPHGSAHAHLREDTPNGHTKNDPKIEEFWQKFNNWIDGKEEY